MEFAPSFFAMAGFREAMDQIIRDSETDSSSSGRTALSMALKTKADIQERDGDLAGALASVERALAVDRADLGDAPNDAGVSHTLEQLGRLCQAIGDVGNALKHLELAADCDSPQYLPGTLARLASILAGQGRKEEAMEHIRRATAAMGTPEYAQEASPTDVARAKADIAAAEALTMPERSASLLAASFNHTRVANSLGGIDGLVDIKPSLRLISTGDLLRLGELEKVKQALRTLLSLKADIDYAEETYARAHITWADRFNVELQLGSAYSKLSRPAQAIPCFKAALEQSSTAYVAGSLVVAAWEGLAEAHEALGQAEEAAEARDHAARAKRHDLGSCAKCKAAAQAESGLPLKRCICRSVSYCSVACQQADWSDQKAECKLLRGKGQTHAEVDAGLGGGSAAAGEGSA